MRGIERDFNLIAQLPDKAWNHNVHYHQDVLNYLGWGLDHVLDVGCGKGVLTRELSARCAHAVGIDLSPGMIKSAREEAGDTPGLEFTCADYMETAYPRGHFDAIVSIAAVHHMDMENFLEKAKYELVTGGKLVVIDLYRDPRWSAVLHDIAALAASKYLHLKYNGKLCDSSESRHSWRSHSQKDTYLSYEQIEQSAQFMLPGYMLNRLFFWRYWLSWVKV